MNSGDVLMTRQLTLRPSDLVVACQLTLSTDSSFASLASGIGLSTGECHNAVRRLGMASLMNAMTRRPVVDLLVRFLVFGAPHAFPPMLGPSTIGVPTAQSSPPFEGSIAEDGGLVWPDADGTARGLALTPLFTRAAELPRRNPPLYEVAAIIDTLRVGNAREKKIAEELLRERFSRST